MKQASMEIRNEKFQDARLVIKQYRNNHSDLLQNAFFRADLSSYKRTLYVSRGTELRNGCFVYYLEDDTVLKIHWHKYSEEEIIFDKINIQAL